MADPEDAQLSPQTAAPVETDRERGLRREDLGEEWVAGFASQAARLGNYPMLSAAEREASRRSFLDRIGAGEDTWVFAYGSLMWNPALEIAETRRGHVAGLHRRFCLSLLMGRGSVEQPGLMLALDRGGSCGGLVHRIAAGRVESELAILWTREMLSGAYRPRWVTARTPLGEVRAIAFTANRDHPRYLAQLGEDLMVDRLARAAGTLGTNRHYLFRLVEQLNSLGFPDGPMHRLARRVRERAGE